MPQPGPTISSARAYDLIASVAEDARRNARARVEVEGFTDTSGTHDYNMTLSQARAEHVADLLVRHGVKPERILARGYGETRLGQCEPAMASRKRATAAS